MQVQTINSSKLSWEAFKHSDGSVTYCADGDGFVELEQHASGDFFNLNEQGSPIADIEGKTLAEALEIAQSYLAANYPGIFAHWSQQFAYDKELSEMMKNLNK